LVSLSKGDNAYIWLFLKDFDHRVREATQQAHFQLVTKAGKKLAPHLKLIITDWLMSHFDTYAPSASIAKLAFDQVFQDKKKKEVFSFCKKDIVEVCYVIVASLVVKTQFPTNWENPLI